jgi:hypothetical protein
MSGAPVGGHMSSSVIHNGSPAFVGTNQSYGPQGGPGGDWTSSKQPNHLTEWAKYFDTPMPTEHDPYASWNRSVRTVEDAFNGRSRFMEQIMITHFAVAQQFTIRRLLPWTENAKGLSFEWDTWHFNDHMLTDEPAFAVPRLVTSKMSKNKENLKRHGIGLALEWEFYKTERGRLALRYHILQIINAVLFTMALNVMLAILNPAWEGLDPMYRNLRFASTQLMRAHANQITDNFAGVHKDPNWLSVRLAAGIATGKGRIGKAPDCFVMPSGTSAFAAGDPALINKLFVVPAVRFGGHIPDTPMISKEGGITIFESQPLPQGMGVPPIDPLYCPRVISTFSAHEWRHISHLDYGEFKTQDMDIMIYSEIADDWVRIAYRDSFAMTGMFETPQSAARRNDGITDPNDSRYTSPDALAPLGQKMMQDYTSWAQFMEESDILHRWLKILSHKNGTDPLSIACADARESFNKAFAGTESGRSSAATVEKVAIAHLVGTLLPADINTPHRDVLRSGSGSTAAAEAAAAAAQATFEANARDQARRDEQRALAAAAENDRIAAERLQLQQTARDMQTRLDEAATRRTKRPASLAAAPRTEVKEANTGLFPNGGSSSPPVRSDKITFSDEFKTEFASLLQPGGTQDEMYMYVTCAFEAMINASSGNSLKQSFVDNICQALINVKKSGATRESLIVLADSMMAVYATDTVPEGTGIYIAVLQPSGTASFIRTTAAMADVAPASSLILAPSDMIFTHLTNAQTVCRALMAEALDPKTIGILRRERYVDCNDVFGREYKRVNDEPPNPSTVITGIIKAAILREAETWTTPLFGQGAGFRVQQMRPYTPARVAALLTKARVDREFTQLATELSGRTLDSRFNAVSQLISVAGSSSTRISGDARLRGVREELVPKSRYDSREPFQYDRWEPTTNSEKYLDGKGFRSDIEAVYAQHEKMHTNYSIPDMCEVLVTALGVFNEKKINKRVVTITIQLALHQFYEDAVVANLSPPDAHRINLWARINGFLKTEMTLRHIDTVGEYLVSDPVSRNRIAATLLHMYNLIYVERMAERGYMGGFSNLFAPTLARLSVWPTAKFGGPSEEKDFEAILRSMPIDARLPRWGMDNHMPPLINILNVRQPSWTTGTGVLMSGDGVTGFTIHARQNFFVSVNTAQEILNARYSLWAKAVILNAAAIQHFDNMVIKDYIGGNHVEFYNPLDPNDHADYAEGNNTKDIFAIPIRTNEHITDNSFISITGHFHKDLKMISTIDDKLHFSTAEIWAQYWGWEHDETHPLDSAKYSDSYTNNFCTMSWRDSAWVCGSQKFNQSSDRNSSDHLKRYVAATGHFKENYRGVAATRRMATQFIEKQNYDQTSTTVTIRR